MRNEPARVVQVTMGEMDGKMMFMPTKIDVKKGRSSSSCATTVNSSMNSCLPRPPRTSSTPKP